MKFIITLLLSTIAVFESNAQHVNTSSKEAMDLQKKILLIALPEEDKHFLSQLAEENPEFSTSYKSDIEGQRAAFRKTVSEQWTFNDSLVFCSQKDAKILLKNAPEKYAVLKFDEQNQDKVYVKDHHRVLQTTGWEKQGDAFLYMTNKRYSVGMLGITSLVIESPKIIQRVYLPKISPSEGDFIFALHHMEYLLSTLLKSETASTNKIYREASALSEHLKNKTLLLDRNELGCQPGDIQKGYPYPFSISSYAEVEKALQRRDKDIVVVQSVRYDAHNSAFYLCNAGDGTVYRFFTDPTFKYGEIDGSHYTIQVFYPAINAEHFRLYGGK